MGAPITKDIAAFKRVYKDTGTLKAASLAAGYSLRTANMGLTPLPRKLKRFVEKHRSKLENYGELGRAITAEERKDIARGALLANISAGKDASVQSLKLIGQDRDVNLWQQESVAGLFVLEVPQSVAASIRPKAQTKVIEAESVSLQNDVDCNDKQV